ncbi:MAG: DinB family protein [Candidatus Dormibacteraeota bacterium]|nr:DinB family protein [Candidatus Dormibacteraeota bacterium]
MKIESPDFTQVNVRAFLEETLDHERLGLARRLESASARLAELVRRGIDQQGAGERWSGQEILAHIVVMSKFYGMVTKQVGSGRMTAVDLLGAAQARDVAAEPLLSVPPETLLAMVQREHRRTVTYLRGASAMDLARRATVLGDDTMSAHEVAVLPLCAHLEIHLDQLEQAGRR